MGLRIEVVGASCYMLRTGFDTLRLLTPQRVPRDKQFLENFRD